jgi:hypothetical protein
VSVVKYLSYYERYSIPESEPVTGSLSGISLLRTFAGMFFTSNN